MIKVVNVFLINFIIWLNIFLKFFYIVFFLCFFFWYRYIYNYKNVVGYVKMGRVVGMSKVYMGRFIF